MSQTQRKERTQRPLAAVVTRENIGVKTANEQNPCENAASVKCGRLGGLRWSFQSLQTKPSREADHGMVFEVPIQAGSPKKGEAWLFPEMGRSSNQQLFGFKC